MSGVRASFLKASRLSAVIRGGRSLAFAGEAYAQVHLVDQTYHRHDDGSHHRSRAAGHESVGARRLEEPDRFRSHHRSGDSSDDDQAPHLFKRTRRPFQAWTAHSSARAALFSGRGALRRCRSLTWRVRPSTQEIADGSRPFRRFRCTRVIRPNAEVGVVQ